jgi:hypothetical protein
MNWEEAWPVFPMPMGYASDIFMIADSNVVNGNGNIVSEFKFQWSIKERSKSKID